MNEQKVSISLGARSYDIHVSGGLLSDIGALIKPQLDRPRCFIVTDKNIAPLHLQALTASLDNHGISHQTKILEPGEQTKSMTITAELLDDLFEFGIDRQSTLIAFGGGVIGDLAGFAAAIAMRGIKFIQIPTTLLAQVDSAVGGKTAVDVRAGKNLVGCFHQPQMVISDIDMLKTLPLRELKAGLGEVIKHGLLGDYEFFTWLEEHAPSILDGNEAAAIHAVAHSCRMKGAIVEADEQEKSGQRALLNLGHTFGHAYEQLAHFSEHLLHGEAVAIGIYDAFRLAQRMGRVSQDDIDRVLKLYAKCDIAPRLPSIFRKEWTAQEVIKAMQQDKKVSSGNLVFVLPKGLGQTSVVPNVSLDLLTDTIEESLQIL